MGHINFGLVDQLVPFSSSLQFTLPMFHVHIASRSPLDRDSLVPRNLSTAWSLTLLILVWYTSRGKMLGGAVEDTISYARDSLLHLISPIMLWNSILSIDLISSLRLSSSFLVPVSRPFEAVGRKQPRVSRVIRLFWAVARPNARDRADVNNFGAGSGVNPDRGYTMAVTRPRENHARRIWRGILQMRGRSRSLGWDIQVPTPDGDILTQRAFLSSSSSPFSPPNACSETHGQRCLQKWTAAAEQGRALPWSLGRGGRRCLLRRPTHFSFDKRRPGFGCKRLGRQNGRGPRATSKGHQ
ncbi:hypothetical protein DFH09DRAFT_134221 [Mycena vulgaris]|nr:hypothetical protein DFH09DRAFT_134221 [Mycena vulgaris]